MGEIAEDCYDRAMDELENLMNDPWAMEDYHDRMRANASRRAHEVQLRRAASMRSVGDLFSNLDDPPF